jgi:hypothetical protein
VLHNPQSHYRLIVLAPQMQYFFHCSFCERVMRATNSQHNIFQTMSDQARWLYQCPSANNLPI